MTRTLTLRAAAVAPAQPILPVAPMPVPRPFKAKLDRKGGWIQAQADLGRRRPQRNARLSPRCLDLSPHRA